MTNTNDGEKLDQENKTFEQDEITEPCLNLKETNESNQEFEAIKTQLEQSKNDFLYLRAEFENYKKQTIKERSDLIRYGAERLIVSLLDVIDNFDRALGVQVNTSNYLNYIKGVEMTAAELKAALLRFGVTEIPSPQGQAFDPAFNEALSSEETETVPPGHITRILRKAYKLHDKVIRPGQVVVASVPNKQTQP